jgi:polar amino acid transport system substrate-binding protein
MSLSAVRLLACMLALACAGAFAAGRKLVLAATEYPPYYSESLPGGGPVTELTLAALHKAGYQTEVRFLPWVRALRLGTTGQVDGLIGVWHAPEREAAFLYSKPVVANRIVLCGRAGHLPVPRFTRFEALKPYTIGTVAGYADPPELAAAGLKTEAVTDDLQNLRKLLAGRIDLALIDSRVARYLADRHLGAAAREMQCLQPPVQEHPQYLVVSRHAKEAERVVGAFNEQLKVLHASGEYAEIAARWGF